MDRRNLSATAGRCRRPLVVAGPRLRRAARPAARLLVVFLRGAYDAANVVAPAGERLLPRSRGRRSRSPSPIRPIPMRRLPLDADWGLHPGAEGHASTPLWQKKQVAFVPFAGTDDLTRSHFETQDTIELGQPLGGTRDYGSGFMARLAAALAGDEPIAFTDQLPLSFRGGADRSPTSRSTRSASRPSIAAQARADRGDVPGRQPALSAGSVAEGFAGARRGLQDDLPPRWRPPTAARSAPKGFELSARRIGRLMRDQFNLAFVDVGGWDTHVNQGGAPGLSRRRGSASWAAAWPASPTRSGPEAWRNDHRGRGLRVRPHLPRERRPGHRPRPWQRLLGAGRRRERRPAGRASRSRSRQATLNQNRDLPVLTDYRALIGGVVKRKYGIGDAALGKVFPGASPADLQLV